MKFICGLAGTFARALNTAPVGFLLRPLRLDLFASHTPGVKFPRGEFFKYTQEETQAGVDRTFWLGGFELVVSKAVH